MNGKNKTELNLKLLPPQPSTEQKSTNMSFYYGEFCDSFIDFKNIIHVIDISVHVPLKFEENKLFRKTDREKQT